MKRLLLLAFLLSFTAAECPHQDPTKPTPDYDAGALADEVTNPPLVDGPLGAGKPDAGHAGSSGAPSQR